MKKKKNATPEYLLQIHLQLFNSVIIRFKTFEFFRKFLYITLLKAWYKFRERSAVKPQPCLRTVLFLWRYEPVRRTGKSDDWLTIFLLT